MLKHGIKNYFQQITKTLSVCLGWNTAHTDLLLCKYVCIYDFFQVKIFAWLDKICKTKSLFKSTSCHDISVKFISS